MIKQSINVLGYTANESFVVKTFHAGLRITEAGDSIANPFEFLLGGLAGYLNTVGNNTAKEMGISLRSLQVEIRGDLSVAGFTKIRILLMPNSGASLPALQRWLKRVQEQSRPYSCLVASPIDFVLYKEYLHN